METNTPDKNDLSQILFKMGDWLVDPRALKIENGNEVRSVRAKTMEVLLLLAERSGNVVMRDDIIERVWNGNSYVAAKGVTNTIWNLRQILDDTADTPKYIETIAKKGYRLLTPIQALELSPPLISQLSKPTETSPLSESGNAVEAALLTPNSSLSLSKSLPLFFYCLMSIILIASVYFLLRAEKVSSVQLPLSSASMSIRTLFSTPEEESLLSVSPDEKQYAYVAYRGLNTINQVYLRRFDADTPATLLWQSPNRITSLAFHPGGEFITLGRWDEKLGCVIENVDLKTRHAHFLQRCATNSIGRFSWSADGKRLAFVAQNENGSTALVEHHAESQHTQVIREIANDEFMMVIGYEPQQQSIAAILRTSVGNNSLVLINHAGQQNIIWDAGNRFLYPVGAWSSEHELLLSMVPDGMSPQFMKVDIKSGSVSPTGIQGISPHVLKNQQLLFLQVNMQLDIAAYSIAEKKLLSPPIVRRPSLSIMPSFASNHEFAFLTMEGEDWSIFGYRTGAEPKKISIPATDVGAPSMSSDGNLLAVIGNCINPKEQSLCILNLQTKQLRTAAIAEGELHTPFWLPNHNEIIVPVKDNTQNSTRLAHFLLQDGSIAWSPAIPKSEMVKFSSDGKRVYWTQPHQPGIYARDTSGGSTEWLAPELPANSPLWAVRNQSVYFLVKDTELNWALYLTTDTDQRTEIASLGKILLSQLGGIAVNEDESLLLLPFLSMAEIDLAIAEPKK